MKRLEGRGTKTLSSFALDSSLLHHLKPLIAPELPAGRHHRHEPTRRFSRNSCRKIRVGNDVELSRRTVEGYLCRSREPLAQNLDQFSNLARSGDQTRKRL